MVLVRIFRTTAGPDPANPTLIACYWFFVPVAGFGATAWWYRSLVGVFLVGVRRRDVLGHRRPHQH